MTVWFEGSSEIACSIEQVKSASSDHGEHFAGVAALMPGLTDVELVEHTDHSVTIRTNEGLMKRTNLVRRIEASSVIVEFDEVYEAGTKVTTTSHFLHEFRPSTSGVTHRLVISDVSASGFLGFLYRRFGSSKTGNAFLRAYEGYFVDSQG